jgi:hypothetical protein
MLHWNNRLTVAVSAALIAISAVCGDLGWTWR